MKRNHAATAHESFTSKTGLRSFFVAFAMGITLASAQAASGTWNGTTDATWAGANWSTTPVPGTGDTATFNGAGNSNTTINLGGGVTIGSLLFDSSAAAAYTIGSGAVGSQILTLSNSGSTGGSIVVDSNVTTAQTINSVVSLGSDTTPANFTLTNNSSQLLTLASNVVNSNVGITGTVLETLTVNGTGNTTILGQIGQTFASPNNVNNNNDIALVKDGSGTLTIGTGTGGGNNKMTGSITIKDGTLALASPSSFFNGTTSTTPLNIGDGVGTAGSALLIVTATNGSSGIGANSAVFNISSDGQLNLNGKTVGSLTDNLPSLTVNFTNGGGGTVLGNGGNWLMGDAATTNAAGNFVLSGAGTWNSGGGLFHMQVNAGTAAPEAATMTLNSGASFLSGGGNILISTGSTTGDTTTVGSITITSNGNGTIDTGTGYLILGLGDGSPNAVGSTTEVLKDTGTGTFLIAGNIALGEVPNSTTVPSGTTVPTFTAQEIANQSNRTLQIQSTSAASIVNITAAIADGNAAGPTNNGININGGVAGGKVIFSGANTYTGGTTIATNTFLVNNTTGSGTGTGFVTMTSGVLGGSGIIAPTGTNKVTASGGTVTPGSGTDTGHLTVSALGTTLVANTALVQLAGAGLSFNLSTSNTSSYLNLTSSYQGEVSGLSGNTFNFTDLTSGGLAVGKYTLILSDDSSTNPFQGLSLGVLSGFTLTGLTGYTDQLELNQIAGTNDYAIQLEILTAPVPEPKTWALLVGGVLLMVACQRRRQLGLN